MAMFQQRGGQWQAIVRRKGLKPNSKTFPARTLAKVWADRIEREMAEQTARGHRDLDARTLSETFAWYRKVIGNMKRLSSTQKGNCRYFSHRPLVANATNLPMAKEWMRQRFASAALGGKSRFGDTATQ